jgi:hypothetical protein
VGGLRHRELKSVALARLKLLVLSSMQALGEVGQGALVLGKKVFEDTISVRKYVSVPTVALFGPKKSVLVTGLGVVLVGEVAVDMAMPLSVGMRAHGAACVLVGPEVPV